MSSALEVTRRRESEKESCSRTLGIVRSKKDLGSQEGATRGLFYKRKFVQAETFTNRNKFAQREGAKPSPPGVGAVGVT